MSAFQSELDTIRTLFSEIGRYLQQFPFHKITVQTKEDGSPVTNGDLEINRIIQERIQKNFPQDGWLSEETPDDLSRLEKRRTWIIDPIDGTKPFQKALPQYVISIALIDQGQPVIGALYNPGTREHFWGVHGRGAMTNGRPMQARQTALSPLTLLVNPWNVPHTILKQWKQEAHCQMILGSIAYSLALVANGQVDGVINIGSQNEWDIAASLCLIQEAGGIVVDRQQHPIRCNKSQPVVDGIIATSPQALPRVFNLIERYLA